MYAQRTTLRMLVALAASLVFTLTSATVAAKYRRAEMVLIPLVDVDVLHCRGRSFLPSCEIREHR
jgi:ABC-type anion transport system duplicated permease subunit